MLLTWLPVIVALILLTFGAMTAAKGRWMWFLGGIATGGLVWIYSAQLSAAHGSLWARMSARRLSSVA